MAGEQSSRNWGWIRTQGRDADEVPIARESLKVWDTLSEETGEDLGFSRQGIQKTVYIGCSIERQVAGFDLGIQFFGFFP